MKEEGPGSGCDSFWGLPAVEWWGLWLEGKGKRRPATLSAGGCRLPREDLDCNPLSSTVGESFDASIFPSITWGGKGTTSFLAIEGERNLVGVWVTMLTLDPSQNPAPPGRFSHFLLSKPVIPLILYAIHLFP